MKPAPQKLIGAAAVMAFGAAAMFVVATARKVKANRADWRERGFYGLPVYVKAVTSAGKKVDVTLTSSRIEPMPDAIDEWLHAAKAVVRDLDPR